MTNELPTAWTNTSLSSLVVFNPKHPATIPDETPVTFVPMAAVSESSPRLDTSQTRPLGEVRKGYTHFSEGDVLFAKITPCMENGKGGVASGLKNGLGCGTTELVVLRSLGGVDPLLLYRFLAQPSVRREAKENFTGTAGQARVPVSFLENLELPLAPLAEQRRIVAKLEQVLSKVDTCQRRLAKILALLKRFRQSVLAAACSGRLTVDWREENAVLESDQLQAAISERQKVWLRKQIAAGNRDARRIESKLTQHEFDTPARDLPAGWIWSSLLKVCWLVVDCHNKTAPYVPSGVPLIRTTNIRGGRLLLDEVKFVSEETYAYWSRRCPPQPGDILFTREAPMGECAVIPDGARLCMGQRTMLLRVFDEYVQPKFLSFAIQDPCFQQRLDGVSVGSGVKHLRVGDVERLVVPLPSFPEQREIVRRVEALFALADKIEARYAKAQAQVDRMTPSLLARAFAGKLVPQDPADEPAAVLLKRIRQGGIGDPALQRVTTYPEPVPRELKVAESEPIRPHDSRRNQGRHRQPTNHKH